MKTVWAEWKEQVEGGPFRRGLDAGLELVIQKKASKWLADTKLLGATTPADLRWINEDWTPRAVNGGVRWMAFVLPKKVVARMAVKSFVSKLNEKELITAYFDDIDEARSWLRAQA